MLWNLNLQTVAPSFQSTGKLPVPKGACGTGKKTWTVNKHINDNMVSATTRLSQGHLRWREIKKASYKRRSLDQLREGGITTGAREWQSRPVQGTHAGEANETRHARQMRARWQTTGRGGKAHGGKDCDRNPPKHQTLLKPEPRIATFLKRLNCSQSCCQRSRRQPHLAKQVPPQKNPLPTLVPETSGTQPPRLSAGFPSPWKGLALTPK